MFGPWRRNRITADPDDPSAARQRLEMVERQLQTRGIYDPMVLEAFRTVPRHLFVPKDLLRDAYADRALAIPAGQTISQPYIVGLMTQALCLTPESKVLEIGSGSGYQGAILANLTPHVFSIEIVEDLHRVAQEAWRACGLAGRITSRLGDGAQGWPEQKPFDAIIVTCAPASVPEALKQQLALGGKLCIPLGTSSDSQELFVLTRESTHEFSDKKLIPVRFVPMTGSIDQP
jgi:protein-L-isoaspartate(D-aspartate) O-methyltransferase